MDRLSKAIQVLEDQINYSVRNMDEVMFREKKKWTIKETGKEEKPNG